MTPDNSRNITVFNSLFEERLVQDSELDPIDEINRRTQISRIKRDCKSKRFNNANDIKTNQISSPLSSNDTLLDLTVQN